MKRCLLIFLTMLSGLIALSDTPQNEYINKYAAIAVSEMQRSGVPASITLAQGMLESRNGLSGLAADGNNHFGIKCHRNWKGKTMRVDDDRRNECFRVYKTAEESFRDHSDFLRYQDRYKELFELKPTDYKGWAKGLKKAGYATDPKYAEKLIKLIEDYKLYQFDTGKRSASVAGGSRPSVSGGGAVSVPQSPLKIEKDTQVQVENPNRRRSQANERYTFRLNRKVYKKNGILCVYAEHEDTYESIALEFNLFQKEILKFNDLTSARKLKIGEVVYLKAKKKYASKGLPMYVVGDKPETLWEISQRFGVKLKSIYKLNGFPEGYVPCEGDVVYMRKVK
ncbi:MAG: glucosaminidase domain-containing protein [Bacteroidales bacterium]|nr:glucosaminidase domain-containing protein [Bacteroidales bacterium]